MFRRSIEEKLKQWAEKDNRKPLVLRGARQVGKTTIVNKFGKQFENFLSVNLEKDEVKMIFERHDDVHRILEILFLYCNIEQKTGRTLLFIDEIQSSSKAVALLRYFYEELPGVHVIAAGSLLENMLNKHISLPVGRVEYMALHPCSFVEFLYAMKEERFVELIEKAELPDVFHEKLMQLFTIYALIGGMPEIVARYAEKRDIILLSDTYNQLLNAYKGDVEKYAKNNTQLSAIRHILEEGWSFSGQTITLGSFAQSPYKARENGEAFRTLEKALLLELVYPITGTQMPAMVDLKRAPKLIWLDAGLVNYAAEIQREYLLSTDLTDTWRGMAAEQIVAQELKVLSNEVGKKLKFWIRPKKGSNAEVDFIFVFNGKIIPIEVKSGHNAHLKSLHLFMDEAPHQIAVRVWSGNFSIDEVCTNQGKTFKLINLPFYMISALPHLVESIDGRW